MQTVRPEHITLRNLKLTSSEKSSPVPTIISHLGCAMRSSKSPTSKMRDAAAVKKGRKKAFLLISLLLLALTRLPCEESESQPILLCSKG
jgi:hypothetical protein